MHSWLPLAAAVGLLVFADHAWKARPLRWPTDETAQRVVWILTLSGLALGVGVWGVLALSDSAFRTTEVVFVAVTSWFVTLAAGRLAMWSVAWRIAEARVAPDALPKGVLWAASLCIWIGVLRMLGAAVGLLSLRIDIPLDGILLFFGGTSVLERSNGWRRCMVVVWALLAVVSIALFLQAALASFGVGQGPALRFGTVELPIPAVAVAISAVLVLFSTLLTSAFASEAARSWCTPRTADAPACPSCGYNLTGLDDPKCPECGAPRAES